MKYLIVVDMQNDFIDGSLGSESAKKIVPAVVKKMESLSKKDLIILTKDTHNKNYLESLEGEKLPVKHCIYGESGWDINKDIIKAAEHSFASTKTVLKGTFGSISLAESLRGVVCDEDEIELIGLCTGICVASNAIMIRAFLPNTKISVDAECCACVTEESHNSALKTMQMCQIDIKNWSNV